MRAIFVTAMWRKTSMIMIVCTAEYFDLARTPFPLEPTQTEKSVGQ